MDEFIAIPVGQGDAFFLQRDGHTILVDGGNNRRAFPAMFCIFTGKQAINTLVCTHNDSDHANGVLGYLESGLRCDELWLPGKWLQVLDDVLQPLEQVMYVVCEEVRKMSAREREALLRKFLELDREPPRESSNREQRQLSGDERPIETELDCGGWPLSMISRLEDAVSWHNNAVTTHVWGWHAPLHYYGGPQAQLVTVVIEAAARIREAALLAFQRGISVRWFEHCPSAPTGGLPGIFTPVNAKEIFAVPKKGTNSLTDVLYLTVYNQESLVFWSHPTATMPGVLFNADSDLSGVNLNSYPMENAISTSPHHGSDDNADAYDVVIQSAAGAENTMTWVRSDCRSRTRPGEAYLALPGRRYCTLCRPAPNQRHTPIRPMEFTSQASRWIPTPASEECNCWPRTQN